MNNDTKKNKILNALQLILQENVFEAAPKSSAFLRYVVTQTLDGNGDRIKAYSIAVDALGKPATFDPQNDPSVRVMAQRIRHMLRDYYERKTEHEVVLQLIPGSYVPQFVFCDSKTQSTCVLKIAGT